MKRFKELLFGGFLLIILKAAIIICFVIFSVGLLFIYYVFHGGPMGMFAVYCLGIGFSGYISLSITYLIVRAAYKYITEDLPTCRMQEGQE